MSNLMLDVGQANELKLALREARGGDGSEWTNADIKNLSKPSVLGPILDYLRDRAEIVIKSILSVFKTVTIMAVAEKKTADCLTNQERYYYRDPNLDALLPEVQEEQTEGKAIAHQLSRPAKFVEMVQNLLCTTETDIDKLSRLVIEAGQVFSLTQIESLIERQEAGEDIGLRTDSWGNFFLVLNKKGSVSVLYAGRSGGLWVVSLCSLSYGRLWGVEDRFFSRLPAGQAGN